MLQHKLAHTIGISLSLHLAASMERKMKKYTQMS